MPSASRILRGDTWAKAIAEVLADSPLEMAAWMEHHTRILKSDDFSLVGLMPLGQELCYLKYYQAKSPVQRLSFRLGIGRGVSSFDSACELQAASIAVPEPRACLLVTQGMLLLTQGFDDAVDLKGEWMKNPPPDRIRGLLAASGQALGELHRAGYAHGDCKWSNFLCRATQVYFIDLEAVQSVSLDSVACARDLARFTLNSEDMGLPAEQYEHFLTSYGAVVGRAREELFRSILPPLEKLRRRHLAKYGERGARLL